MEKKEYIKPEIEVIELEQEDIIRTSSTVTGSFGNRGGVTIDFTQF